MNDKKYDWIIVGGGIAGISIAEILSREGKTVLLIEKNDKVASETSKVFHEWLHSGSLYSLVPDNFFTMRYLLGAIDDLFEYYQSYKNMNLIPKESGLAINSNQGWFNNDFINYHYKIRKLNPIWLSIVSRSLNVVEMIKNHDWLRRHAGGSEYSPSIIKTKFLLNKIKDQFFCSDNFFSIESPDFTMNSRVMINDLLSSAKSNGMEIITSETIIDIREINGAVLAKSARDQYKAENIVICSPDILSKKYDIPIKLGYAPMAIVDNVPDEESSFVELDYYINKCINLLKKDNNIAQVGGATVKKPHHVKPYLDFIINEHKKRNPEIRVIDDYVGIKKELISKNEPRNYIYHISRQGEKVWSVVLGKFTLAFSMAPEFYRRIYKRNPSRIVSNNFQDIRGNYISKTSWQEIVDNERKENGYDKATKKFN